MYKHALINICIYIKINKYKVNEAAQMMGTSRILKIRWSKI